MTDFRYQGKVVVITGGSRGIGEGCAREFILAGAKVVIASNNEADGNSLAANLKKFIPQGSGGDICFTFCDVTKTADIRSLIDATISRYGRLDCLVNNAGWHPPHLTIDEFSVEDFRGLLELNLVSVFTASKFALPYLRKTKGNIINISSLVATIGQGKAATYSATKGAIPSLTKALAIDEAQYGVRVNSISPGNIYTPLWQEAIDAAEDPQQCRADGEAVQLLGRMGTIEEVGKLCLFIAADATFTTGVDHIISGGAELDYGRKHHTEP